MTNEMRVLQEFVEEFSPIHQGQTKDMCYDELFAVVAEVSKEYWGCGMDNEEAKNV